MVQHHQKSIQSVAQGRHTGRSAEQKEVVGVPITGPMRETRHACEFRGVPQSGRQCRNRDRAEAAETREDTFMLNLLLFFLVPLQKQQSHYCAKHRQKRGPLSPGFPMHDPSGNPHAPEVLLTLASSSWLSRFRLQHG